MIRIPPSSFSRTRRVCIAWCGAKTTLWSWGEYKAGAWNISEQQNGLALGNGAWGVPPSLQGQMGSGKTIGLVILAPMHHETRLLQYPRAMGKRMASVLEFDVPEHSLRLAENLIYFHKPILHKSMLTVSFHAMERSLYETIQQTLLAAGMTKTHVVPDVILIPEIWAKLCPCTPNGVLTGYTQHHFLAYSVTQKAVAEALSINEIGPIANLWEIKTRERASLVPMLHLVERGEPEGLPASGEKKPQPHVNGARQACLLATWPEMLAHEALLADPVQGFTGQFRLTPKRPSLPALTAAALILLHVLAFTALYKYRGFKQEMLHAVSTAVSEMRSAWAPLEAQGRWINSMEAMERALAGFEEKAVPVESLLSLLTRVTPQDTWLRELCLEGTQLTVAGEASEALAYRNTLTALPPFHDVQFTGNVTKAKDQAKERFTLVLKVDGQALRSMRQGNAP